MSPKEKAEEIVNTYYIKLHCSKGYYDIENARLCAIIAVNEILNEYPSQCPIDSYEMERHLFWVEVKKEI